MHPVIVNSLGVPLDMGRQIRLANQAQRRALALRDGGCCFPGCDRPPQHCDAHHIDHWTRDLGRTDVAHMALFCRHHHGVIHRHGSGTTIDTHGRTTITTPHGHTLTGQQHGRLPTDPQRAGP
ncbi:MAG: HNH endonuclease signature motif containing protein [Microthrixaceae bacterium]